MHAVRACLQGARASLHAARAPMHAARATLRGARAPLHAARATLHGVRASMHAARALMHGARAPMHEARAPLHGARAILLLAQDVDENSKGTVFSRQIDNPSANAGARIRGGNLMIRKRPFRQMAAAWNRLLVTVEANQSVLPVGRDHAAQLRRWIGSHRPSQKACRRGRRKLKLDRIYSAK